MKFPKSIIVGVRRLPGTTKIILVPLWILAFVVITWLVRYHDFRVVVSRSSGVQSNGDKWNDYIDITNIVSYPEKVIHARVNPSLRDPMKQTVFIGTVVCDARLDHDLKNQNELAHEMAILVRLANIISVHVDYELHLVYENPDETDYWRNLYAPCATQRLFFPLTLRHIEHIIFLDADTMFLSSVTDLWNELTKMTPLHLAAMSPEHELPADGYYNRYSEVPYYGPRGLNAGVMLMNLTAMRAFDFNTEIMKIHDKYRKVIALADQDMLNILFHFNPTRVHQVSCEFDYRRQHFFCDFPGTGDCGCKSAEKYGASILHGKITPDNKDSTFDVLYTAFQRMDVTDSPTTILNYIKRDYDSLYPSKITYNLTDAFFTKFEKYAQAF